MKKITILFPTLFMGLAMFGQSGVIKKQTTENQVPVMQKISVDATHKTKYAEGDQSQVTTTGNQNKAVAATPFWSDDFSVPSKWNLTPTTMPDKWIIGTTGPAGAYAIPKILSTTAANGFALFDSDLLCSGDQDADLTIAAPIVCTGHANILLSFQQQYRRWYDSTYIEVSSDNITWDQYGLNIPLGNGDYCAGNPNTVNVDISASAGNQPTVWIRFKFFSPSTLGTNAGCGYSWMVDDVSLVDQPANDLAYSQATQGGNKAMVNLGGWNNGFYTMLPKAQTGFMLFHAYADNLGSANQTAAVLTVDVNDGTGSVFNASSAPMDLVVGSKDSALIAFDGTVATVFAAPLNVVASYTATFVISQTETELAGELLNNTTVRAFDVTDTVFAHDDGTINARTSPNYYVGNETDGIMAASYYFPDNDVASSVSAYIATRTKNGSVIQAEIYEVDTTNTGVAPIVTLIASSAQYTVDSTADVSTWKTLSVKTPGVPVVLQAQYTYYAAIHCTMVDANAGTAVFLGEDQSTYQPNAVNWIFDGSSASWGWISGQPMIRLNTVSQTIGVKDIAQNNGVTVSQNMPNPTKGLSTINYQLDKNAAVSLSVYDVTGKKVATQNAGEQSAGKHSMTFNASNFSEGVYYYSLTVGQNTTSTMKMVVIK